MSRFPVPRQHPVSKPPSRAREGRIVFVFALVFAIPVAVNVVRCVAEGEHEQATDGRF